MIAKSFDELCAKYDAFGNPAPGDNVPVNFDLLDDWSWRAGIPRMRFYDDLSICLAQKFISGEMTFELCDVIINDLWGAIIFSRDDFPELFNSVYEAFDAGEYHRRADRSDDPVTEHTIPMIKECLATVGG